MHEKMNRQEAELSEAALEGVSGSFDAYVAKAHQICLRCGYRAVGRHGPDDLIEYLKKNGIDSVSGLSDCPFYGK